MVLGSLFLESLRATPVTQLTAFEAQQPGAPGTFNLWLLDDYRTFAGETTIKFSLLQIQSDGPPDSRITGFFMFDPGVLIAGGLSGGVSGPGPIDAVFALNNRGPRTVPVSIEEAFPVQFWWPLASGSGIAPGQNFQLAADPNRTSLIDSFNAGNLKVGIELADGHTYIAAVPEPSSSLVLVAFAAIILFRIHRVTARKS